MEFSGSDRDLLIRMDQKLTIVCGENGDGGILARHSDQIRALEDVNTKAAGEHSVSSVVAVVSGVTGFLTWIGHAIWAGMHPK